MSALRNIVFGCVTDQGHETSLAIISSKRPVSRPPDDQKPLQRVKFGVSLTEAVKDDQLPEPLVDMLVYIAQEGVTTPDLFRRPGNPTDAKVIVKKLTEGRSIDYTFYNFYTLASVIKKFLLKLPGGVFGADAEQRLLRVLDIDEKMLQYDAIHTILSCLPLASQQLVTLLFGTWFRIINHSEYNTMSSESVAKSVAGSLFHTCADHPDKVKKAVEILQILVNDFAVADMFGSSNIDYFSEVTRTAIDVTEKYKYRLSFTNIGNHSYDDDNSDVDDEQLAQLIPIFVELVRQDVISRGLDPLLNVITEADFLRSSVRNSLKDGIDGISVGNFLVRSSSPPPSPQSLQHSGGGKTAAESNGHRKLAHVSSLSAPEVNQVCIDTSRVPESRSVSPCPYLCTSLSRFDSVKRRQLMRMRKRSNWFLDPPTSSSSTHPQTPRMRRQHDEIGSNGDMSSADPISSDAGISDDVSDNIRVSSDLDCGLVPDCAQRGSATVGSSPRSTAYCRSPLPTRNSTNHSSPLFQYSASQISPFLQRSTNQSSPVPTRCNNLSSSKPPPSPTNQRSPLPASKIKKTSPMSQFSMNQSSPIIEPRMPIGLATSSGMRRNMQNQEQDVSSASVDGAVQYYWVQTCYGSCIPTIVSASGAYNPSSTVDPVLTEHH